jgi:hypothetical protein
MARAKSHQLNALYYPYADIRKSPEILTAALYFDNIYVFEPNFFRPPSSDEDDRVSGAMSVQPLVRAGVVKAIGPATLGLDASFGSPHRLLDDEGIDAVVKGIADDMRNPDLIALMHDSSYVSWDIPTGQQLFWNGLGLLLETSNGPNGSGMEVETERHEFYSRVISSAGYRQVPIKSRNLRRIRRQLLNTELTVRVPLLEAEALMINLALLACSEYDLCPIADEPLHYAFLCKKLASKKLGEHLGACHLDLKEFSLVENVIRLHLPRVEDLTAESVLGLRDKCKDSLERFRLYMGKLKYSLENEIWSPDFGHDVKKIVDTEVLPAVREIKDSLQSKAMEFGIKVIEDSAKLSPIPLLATLAVGLPIGWVLAASAGAIVLKDFLEFQMKRQDVKKNGLYFLLDVSSV